MGSEAELQNEIRLELSRRNVITTRVNVIGSYSKDGRYIPPNVPKGHSDLIAYDDKGNTFFLEIKVKPNKPTKEQLHFIDTMRKRGFKAGVVYSVQEALILIDKNHSEMKGYKST